MRLSGVRVSNNLRFHSLLSRKMTDLKEESSSRCFGGYQKTFSHTSESTKSRMVFSAYIPERAKEAKCPVLYYLSGMTCTEQNFIIKSGMQQHANRLGIIVIGPDTSPRGIHKPGDLPPELEGLQEGASWYLDAKMKPFLNHQLYSYVTKEVSPTKFVVAILLMFSRLAPVRAH